MASVDPLEDNTAFAEKNEADFPILSDPGKEMVSAWGVLSERGFASRWTYYIDVDGKVIRIDKEVKPETAGVTLAKTMAELDFPRK